MLKKALKFSVSKTNMNWIVCFEYFSGNMRRGKRRKACKLAKERCANLNVALSFNTWNCHYERKFDYARRSFSNWSKSVKQYTQTFTNKKISREIEKMSQNHKKIKIAWYEKNTQSFANKIHCWQYWSLWCKYIKCIDMSWILIYILFSRFYMKYTYGEQHWHVHRFSL